MRERLCQWDTKCRHAAWQQQAGSMRKLNIRPTRTHLCEPGLVNSLTAGGEKPEAAQQIDKHSHAVQYVHKVHQRDRDAAHEFAPQAAPHGHQQYCLCRRFLDEAGGCMHKRAACSQTCYAGHHICCICMEGLVISEGKCTHRLSLQAAILLTQSSAYLHKAAEAE